MTLLSIQFQKYALHRLIIWIDLKLVIQLSTVTLGNFFDLFFLLKGVTGLDVVLLDVDDLISQAFSNGLGSLK